MILPKGRRSLRSPAHKGKFIASIAQPLALSGCQMAEVESRNGSPGGSWAGLYNSYYVYQPVLA